MIAHHDGESVPRLEDIYTRIAEGALTPACMKIVHLLGWYFPDSVGALRYVEGLCRRLKDAGHEVLIAAPMRIGRCQSVYGATACRSFDTQSPTTRRATRPITAWRCGRAEHLSGWLADERPDILHVHSIKTGVGLPEFREARRLGFGLARRAISRALAICAAPANLWKAENIPATASCGQPNAPRAA